MTPFWQKNPIKNKGLKTSDLLLLFLQKVFEGTKIATFGGFSMFFSELSALQDNLWLLINTLTNDCMFLSCHVCVFRVNPHSIVA